MTTEIVKFQEEINKELAVPAVMNSLVQITFKGLEINNIKRAMLEGMMRGFTFQNFLKKDIYAIPFKDSYSLVTSIDYARKLGMKGGVVGTSKPEYEEKDGKIISCTVTIQKKTDGTIGDFSATAYFAEYNTGRNLWVSKPRTMIAKIAEMHALRKACPEEMAQVYAEEELSEKVQAEAIDLTDSEKKLRAVKSLAELKTVWATLPIEAKQKLEAVKEEMKKTCK